MTTPTPDPIDPAPDALVPDPPIGRSGTPDPDALVPDPPIGRSGTPDPDPDPDSDKDETMTDPRHTERLKLETRELPQDEPGDPLAVFDDRPEEAAATATTTQAPAYDASVAYGASAAADASGAATGQGRPARVWKTGPSVATVVAGLVCLVIAGLAVVSEIADVAVDWTVTGPGLVLGFGVVLVLLGLLGMVRRRRT